MAEAFESRAVGTVAGRRAMVRVLGVSAALALAAVGAPVLASNSAAGAAVTKPRAPLTIGSAGQAAAPAAAVDVPVAGFRVRSPALTGVPATALTAPSGDFSRFAFTAPGRGAQRAQTLERSFRFTPAGGSADRQVTVGLAARTEPAAAPAAQARAAAVTSADAGMAPAAYDFDLAMAWKGLAVSTELSRSEAAAGGGGREGVGLGLSYGRGGWRTGVRATAERGSVLIAQSPRDMTERYAIEASGALSVAPAVSLGGSLRWQPTPQNPSPLDPNREDRAVFLGGRVAF